ncbi:BamA/TamA family outer membrane protein [Kiritimatiellota bacterium B12222]|nr:BamA/TamA family outer membrane protein [Kiritimatiellota bacterium B12222]
MNKSSLLFAIISTLFAGNLLFAQEKADEKQRSFVVAPALSSSPGFGNGLGAVGLYFFKPNKQDEVSPPSTITAVGMYSDTDSYFTGLFGKFHLQEDQWRIIAGMPVGKVNSSLNVGAPETANFENKFWGVVLEAQRKITGPWYTGLRLTSIQQNYNAKNLAGQAYFEAFDVEDTHAGSLSALLSYDSRDNQRYPESGSYGDTIFTYAPAEFSDSGEYTKLDVNAASFHTIVHDQILALQLKGSTVSDDAPYFEKPTLGSRGDLRGYTPGEIVGDHSLIFQAEYRMRFTKLFGAAIFGGGGGIWEDSFSSEDLYWNYGAGIRIRMQEENRVNFRIDYAVGEDDQNGWYVSVSEAF